MTTLRIEDQVNLKPAQPGFMIELQDGVPVTARLLIAERIRLEWDRRTAMPTGDGRRRYLPLVDMFRLPAPNPGGAQAPCQPAVLSVEAAIERGLAAFQANAFVLLVDDQQVIGLDAPIVIRPTTTVIFLRLVPLVGG